MKIKLETWKSDNNKEEVHIFVAEDDGIFKKDEYVFGYNPKHFSPEWIEALVKALCE